jgi:formylmethanofuran dehydrogenase subunit E
MIPLEVQMDIEKLWRQCVAFHGHECPGLAIGFRASLIAMRHLGTDLNAAMNEDVVCVTENDACGVDAVMVLTGCTLGKGNLVYRGTGKMAFSFFLRDAGKSIRVVLRHDLPEMDRDSLRKYLIYGPEADLFIVKAPHYPAPERTRKFKNVVCTRCGEAAPEHRIRLENGLPLCMDCYKEYRRWPE